MTSKEKYLKKIANQESQAIIDARERIQKRSWLKESQKLALRILVRLDELEWTSKRLAENLSVTPQYVSKLLQGKEKFGWDIVLKIQEVLDLPILHGYVKKDDNKSISSKFYDGKVIAMNIDPNKEASFKPSKTAKIISINKYSEYEELTEAKEN